VDPTLTVADIRHRRIGSEDGSIPISAAVVPRVSVIIGFRDWGVERLRLAVRSHRQSTLQADLEVIVVDYGSRDAACVRRAVEEEGGHLVRVEAAGQPWSRARALNYGIRQAACGHLILTTDSDILFSPRTAETILSEIEKASGREGTYALVQCRDLPPSYLEERLQDFDWASMEASSTLRPRYGMGGCACFPRSFVETVRGYDERMEWWGAEDKDLARRAEAAGIELAWVEHPDARIYHLWHEKILEKHRDDVEFQKTWARNRHYLTESRTIYRNLKDWGGLSSPPVPVSVVIVTRDRADLLAQAIDSVLGQTYQNFELVAVGDGSKGKARQVVESFADPRIRYLEAPQSEVQRSENLGVRAAQGAHVYVMDECDLMLPNCIEDHLTAITPAVAGSFGGWIDFTGKANKLRYHPGKREAPANALFSEDRRVPAAFMLRRELPFFSPKGNIELRGDGVLDPRSADGGHTFEHTGTYVVLRRTHEGELFSVDGFKHQKKSHGESQASPATAQNEIAVPRASARELARLFPAVFGPARKLESADLKASRGESSRQPWLPSRMGLVGDLFPRPAHLVFLTLIAGLVAILSTAWLLRFIEATGFVLGMTVLGAAYALGLLMLWLERSVVKEVKLAQHILENRIESHTAVVNDQIAGIRAQQAEEARRSTRQWAQITRVIRATQSIQRLGLRALPHEFSGAPSEDFLYFVLRCISDTRPPTIIDLGQGPCTVIIAAHLSRLDLDARFYAIGHEPDVLEQTRQMLRENALENHVDLVLAPIRDTRYGRFYDLDAWIAGVERADMLIVRGPPLHLAPQIRRPAMDYFHPVLSQGAFVLFDNGHRESERDNARRWKLEHPEMSLEFVDDLRGCFLLRKPAAGSGIEYFDSGSRFLAAPGFPLGTTKTIFLGGIISTGSTVLKAALTRCDFATSTGTYEEGQHDPDCPSPWPEGTVDPTAPVSQAFHAWVESYCRGPWLIEKTPDRYFHFLAIQKRLGPERSYFLMMQRDPYQTIALIQRRYPEHHGLGPGHPPGRITTDDPGLIRRLQQAIEFHERLRPELQHFRYVRYEALCADPKRILSDILSFLGVGVAPRARERAAALVNQDARRYPITVEGERIRSAANRLCRLWGYPEI